jgi:hypothetical protein
VRCAKDPALFLQQKYRTAKCQVCDQYNESDHMLKCPACIWQICLRCQEIKKKEGKDLQHGSLTESLSLTGPSKRKRLPPASTTPLPPTSLRHDTSVARDTIMNSPTSEPTIKAKGKGKEKAAPMTTTKTTGKKRAAKSKPKINASDDDDDDAFSDPDSPTRKKMRPTATSIRPSRTGTAPATNYGPDTTPTPDTDSDVSSSVGWRLSTMNHAELAQQFSIEVNVRPASRVQELLEQAGVDTAGNRYEQHLLTTHQPVMSSRVAHIPAAVARMGQKTKRLSAGERVERRNVDMVVSHSSPPLSPIPKHPLTNSLPTQNSAPNTHTVRTVAATQALKYKSHSFSAAENDELFNALKEKAGAWVSRIYKQLPQALQATVIRGLDLRLDHVDGAWRVKLVECLEKVARRKVAELEGRNRVEGVEGEWGEGEGEM